MAEAADIYMEAHEGQKIDINNGLQFTVCFICQGKHYKRDCPNLRPQNTAALVHKGWHHNSNMRPQLRRPYNNTSFIKVKETQHCEEKFDEQKCCST
jgi:hypothetical protein